MQLAASGLSNASMAELARHYATTDRTESPVADSGEGAERTAVARPREGDAAMVREGEGPSPTSGFLRRAFPPALPAMGRHPHPATHCIRC